MAASGCRGRSTRRFWRGAARTEIDWPLEDEDETIAIDYTSGTTGPPKGVMYTHRGAYLNALGELIETKMTSDSVYLWTLPMFHCNGWCYPWAVTAIGATHVCLRKLEPGRVWELIREAGVTHFCAAPDGLDRARQSPGGAGGAAAAKADREHRGGTAVADDHRPVRGAGGRDRPCLRIDGGLRAVHRLRVATPLERPPGRGTGPAEGAARESATWSRTRRASSTRRWTTCRPTGQRSARSSCVATTR